ncbi:MULTISPECIES: hypothetical protein [unclassified Ruegeria]|uniref:hypothetical protein n=1 Tax=unclassified Ruegeria TaxID=2625375 RepID=UPI00148936C3|nr:MULTISPECIES: hypothetical protein [unclassified Ruegeria]NOE32667.1 hypothetical protein [Ruegeria sp. HKCCD7318]
MSNATVKSAATQRGALKKNSVSVLGVFGPKAEMRALMRLSSGRVKEVKTGSRVASGTVVAIDEHGIVLRQSGQTKRITIPGS